MQAWVKGSAVARRYERLHIGAVARGGEDAFLALPSRRWLLPDTPHSHPPRPNPPPQSSTPTLAVFFSPTQPRAASRPWCRALPSPSCTSPTRAPPEPSKQRLERSCCRPKEAPTRRRGGGEGGRGARWANPQQPHPVTNFHLDITSHERPALELWSQPPPAPPDPQLRLRHRSSSDFMALEHGHGCSRRDSG
jgi:hypothetical protein